jgi:hypothetical protein
MLDGSSDKAQRAARQSAALPRFDVTRLNVCDTVQIATAAASAALSRLLRRQRFSWTLCRFGAL